MAYINIVKSSAAFIVFATHSHLAWAILWGRHAPLGVYPYVYMDFYTD